MLLYVVHCHHNKQQTWVATLCVCVIICTALWGKMFAAVIAFQDVVLDVDLIV